GRIRPAMVSNRAERPLPEGPVTATRSPVWACRSTSRKAQPLLPRTPRPARDTARVGAPEVVGASGGSSVLWAAPVAWAAVEVSSLSVGAPVAWAAPVGWAAAEVSSLPAGAPV